MLALAGCVSVRLPPFEKALTSNDSATVVLQQRCPVPIAAPRLRDGPRPLPAHWASLLALPDGGAPGYRHVRLMCDDTMLSEAHNWYVPARLTPAMNAALADTDTPFGKVAAPLHFTRERLASQRGRGEGCPSGTILTHRALLRLPDGQALALVVECYTRVNLR